MVSKAKDVVKKSDVLTDEDILAIARGDAKLDSVITEFKIGRAHV